MKRALMRTGMVLALLAIGLATGCGSSKRTTRKIAINEVAALMAESRTAFETESDLELAEIALGSNLKLLEAMSIHHPTQEELNLFLAEGFTMFSLAFVEDKMEQFEESNEELAEHHRKRAIILYLRAKSYANRVLSKRMGVDNIDKLSEADLKKALDGLDGDDIAPVFWYAFSWGSSMNIDRENMEAFSQIGKIEIMMAKVKKWDPTFFFGGAYLFEAIYYGGRSKQLGGKPEVSKANFEKAAELTKRKFLIVPYFYAKTYCVQFQDKKCFDDNTKYVLEAADDIMPEQRLANEFAKRKTRRLIKQRDDLFLD